jgi:hypothetical protein
LHILHIDNIFAVSQRELSNQGTLWTSTGKFLKTKKLIQDARRRKRRKTNSNGLPLTMSGRVSVGRNDINAKYDASYRNPKNMSKMQNK